jgi:redox-sensing transcriptional repressor
VKGILNYAPTRLQVPSDVYVENRDMITSVEKVAFFARRKR